MHRETYTTGVAGVIGLALGCGLLACLVLADEALAQGTTPPAQTLPAAAQPAAAQPAPPARGAAATRQESRQETRQERRRRTSYAACNRQSHNRGLRGGARRRFLVRCKLGYERPRAAPAQAQPVRQP